jgi:hypothetical protein
MEAATIAPLHDPTIKVTAAELARTVGVDMDTVSNWNRRDLIARFEPGRRRLRTRLYSVEEVYKTALMKELVELHIPPSAAREAVNAIWRQWNKKETQDGSDIYAMLMPAYREVWNVALCSRREPQGPLYEYKSVKSTGDEAAVMELPKERPFAMINISNALRRVSLNLSKLLAYKSVMKETKT